MPVERRPDGTLELITPSGSRVPWRLPESRLADLGYEVPKPAGLLSPGSQALAFGDSPQDEGAGGAPNRPDVGRRYTPPSADAGGASSRSAAEGTDRQPADPERQEPTQVDGAPSSAQAAEDKRRAGLRGGASVEKAPDDLGLPGGAEPQREQPRFARIKGGDRLASYTLQRGAPGEFVAGAIGAEGESATADKRALGATLSYEADQNRAESALLGEQIAHEKQLVNEGRSRLHGVRSRVATEEAAIAKERELAESLEQDPHHYWADKSMGAKIISAISILAGGIRAGIAGGENQALKRLDQLIAEDMGLHRAKIDARRRGAQVRETALDKLIARMDPDLAEKELEARQLGIQNKILLKFARDTQDPQLIAKTEALVARREAEKFDRYNEIMATRGDRIVEQHVNVPDQFVQVGGQRPIKPEHRTLAVTLPGGGVKFGRSEVDARAARKKITAASYLSNRLGEVADLVERGKQDRAWWAQNRGRIEALMADVAGSYKEAKELGTLDAGVERLLEKAAGDPAAILSFDEKSVAKLRENQRLQTATVNNIVNYELDDDPASITAPGLSARTLERQ